MATTQILKLVAGMFNGAPGGAILSDLSGAVDAGMSLSELADILENTSQFQSLVGDLDTAGQVEFLMNNFGLTPNGEEGSPAARAQNFFTNSINDGVGLGQIVYQAIVFLESDELPEEFAEVAAFLNNKALVAAVHAENYDTIASVAAGQALFEGVTSTFPMTEEEALQHVQDIIGEPGEPGEPSPLAEALGDLQAAQDARAEFLLAAAENESVAFEIDAALLDADDIEDVATAVAAAVGTTELDVETALGAGVDFIAAGANTRAGLIADGLANKQAAIDDAQEALDAYNAEVAKVDGLAAAITQAKAAAENLPVAEEAFADASADYAGAEVTFEAKNTNVGPLVNNAAIAFLDAGDLPWDPATDPLADLASIVDTGNSNEVLFTHVGGAVTAGAGLGDYVGLNALQASLQALVDAKAGLEAAESAKTDADAALGAIVDLTDGNFTDAEANGSNVLTQLEIREGGLEAAQEELQTLEDAIAAWEAVIVLNAELGDLDDAVAEALAVLTDSEEDGGLGVVLRSGVDNFTADDDVYLFSESAGDQSLTGFGASGEDTIFFGEGFQLVQIAEGQTINNNVGNVGTLEILWEQDGANLNLYVESEPFAGNSSSTADLTTITLVGFNAEDITGFEGGFLMAGVAIA